MIEARKERVRELIRSLESVQVRSQALGEEQSSFESRSSSLRETGNGRNDAAHPPCEAGDDIQSAVDHVRVALGDDNFRGSRSNYNAGLDPGGLLLQNDLALTEYGLGRLFSGLVVGGATSGNHESGSKLAISETKQEIS